MSEEIDILSSLQVQEMEGLVHKHDTHDLLPELNNIEDVPDYEQPAQKSGTPAKYWITEEYLNEQLPERSLEAKLSNRKFRVSNKTIVKILNCMANYTGAHTRAAMMCGVSPSHWSSLRKQYPVLEELSEEMMSNYKARLEEAIHLRAIEGVDEPVFYKGELSGHKRVYDNRLLEKLLNKHAPEYNRKQVELSSNNAGFVVFGPPAENADSWENED